MSQASSRPLSPHLSVFKLIPSMVMSGLHRITGFALTIGLLLLTWWLVAAAAGPDHFALVQKVVGSVIGRLALAGWTFSVFYHLGTGVRHLVFDVGGGLSKEGINRGGWMVVGFAVAATIVTWAIGCPLAK
jgi:succinate dehydrogenase / fumarate reductase cytochrome b subunit